MTALIVIIAIIVILALFFMSTYNRLVMLRNNRENAFADIDVQLKQRHDLIPQLIEAIRGYTKHESGTLIKLTHARTVAISAKDLDQKIAAENQLTSALSGLRISVEAYPELKANTNFIHLQEEMADIENKLAATRHYFNTATRESNNAVEVFPANVIARIFGFKRETMFDVGEQERVQLEKPPSISF